MARETHLVEELDEASRKLEAVNQDLEAGKARIEAVESQLNEQNRQLDSALSDRQGHLKQQAMLKIISAMVWLQIQAFALLFKWT